jgi:hypothetical protein
MPFLVTGEKDKKFKLHFLTGFLIRQRSPSLDVLSSSDKVHSLDFDVCAWIAAAFYIGIVLRENAFRAHLYLIAESRSGRPPPSRACADRGWRETPSAGRAAAA